MNFTIRGTVYDTATGGGVGGVPVSNGEAVVRTDSAGRYALPAEPGSHRFITVTMPDRYRPQGAFFHPLDLSRQPDDGVDFPLIPAPERANRDFCVAHISDTHVTVAAENRREIAALEAAGAPAADDAQAALRWKLYTASPWHEYPSEAQLADDLRRVAAAAAPDLVIATGDLTNVGTLAQLRSYRAAIESVPLPVFSVFGGHDGNGERIESRNGATYTRNYETVLGPVCYSFDWGGRHFIIYASEEAFFSEEDRQRKERWLWADLAAQPAGQEIVLVQHTPPPAAMLDRLSRYAVRVALHGHAHTSKVWRTGQTVVLGTPTLCFGGIDGRPRGFRRVRFTDQGMRARLEPLPRSERPPAATAPAEIALGTAAPPLRRRWQWQIPGGIHRAAPACDGANLLVSLQDESYPGQSGLACLDLATGQPRWQVRTETAVKNSVAVAPPPAHRERIGDGGRCFAVSVTGQVAAYSLGAGELLWQAAVPGYPDQAVCASPVVADGVVYVAATESCAAYDAETGRRLWHTPLSPGTGRSYAEPQLYGGLLIVLIPNQGFLALRRADGAIAWQRSFNVKYYCAGPVVVNDHLVCAGDGGDLAVLAADSGETIWERPGLLGNYAAGLMAADDHIYVTTAAGEAQSYALSSGRRRWRFQAGEALLAMTCYRRQGRSLLAAPVRWRDYVVVGGLDGRLYFLDEASGACVGDAAFGSPISAAPCPTDAGICVGTYDGRLFLYAE